MGVVCVFDVMFHVVLVVLVVLVVVLILVVVLAVQDCLQEARVICESRLNVVIAAARNGLQAVALKRTLFQMMIR